jgi:hypothetical protein
MIVGGQEPSADYRPGKQANEVGTPLTAFEREALVERHCLLFGVHPRPPRA